MPAYWITLPALLALIITEGIGITRNQTYFLFAYLTLPAFLYLAIVFSSSRRIKIPVGILIAIAIFVLLANISTFFFSLDKQVSFESYLFYFSFNLVFIFSYNYKAQMRSLLKYLLPLLGVFFIICSFIIRSTPTSAQVIFAYNFSHNHLGDFLGAALIILTIFLHEKKRWIQIATALLAILFFIMIIVSYSRSAYLALFLTGIFFFIRNYRLLSRKILIAGALSLAVLLVVFFALSSMDMPSTSAYSPFVDKAMKSLKVSPRSFMSGREIYFSQAIRSIEKYPLFGVGAGNFIKASQTYSTKNNFTDSAHNIILETAAQHGLPSALLLLAIGIILLRALLKKESVWGYALIYLFVNFQTDYTYQIYLFLLIAALMAGIVYEEHNTVQAPAELYGLGSAYLLTGFFCITTSLLFLGAGKPLDAIHWYPFNKDAYIQAISGEKNPLMAKKLVEAAQNIAPDDVGITLTEAKILYSRGNLKAALPLYQRLYDENHLVSFSVIKTLYSIKRDAVSKREADRFLTEVMEVYRDLWVPESFKKEVGEFCYINRGEVCKETNWIYPKL